MEEKVHLFAAQEYFKVAESKNREYEKETDVDKRVALRVVAAQNYFYATFNFFLKRSSIFFFFKTINKSKSEWRSEKSPRATDPYRKTINISFILGNCSATNLLIVLEYLLSIFFIQQYC